MCTTLIQTFLRKTEQICEIFANFVKSGWSDLKFLILKSGELFLAIKLQLGGWSQEHACWRPYQVTASEWRRIYRPTFFSFQTVYSCKFQITVEKHLPQALTCRLAQLLLNSSSFTCWKENVPCSTNFRDKLPFVNSTKSLIKWFNENTVAQTFSSYIQFDCEGYAISDTFYRIEIELSVFNLCPVLFG